MPDYKFTFKSYSESKYFDSTPQGPPLDTSQLESDVDYYCLPNSKRGPVTFKMYSRWHQRPDVINLYFVQKRFATRAWDLKCFEDCLRVESPEYCKEHSQEPGTQFLTITNITLFRELCAQKDADDRSGCGKAGGGGMDGGGGGKAGGDGKRLSFRDGNW